MSEKEKKLCEKLAKLPPELQDKFYDKLDGAVMVIDAMEAAKEQPAQQPSGTHKEGRRWTKSR